VTDDSKVNILLVDDRQENLLVLRATLSSLGQNLVEAKSGAEALKFLLEQDFAVILLDVMMPGMDGFETAKIIREREKSRHTPIIFVTAMLRDDADAFKGYSVGAVDYIMKPFQPEIVRSKVSVFVDLFKKTEEIKRQAAHIRQIEQKEFEARISAAERQTELERERLQSEKKTVKAIVEHAPMGLARLNEKQVVLELNDLFAVQFGLNKEWTKGKRLFEIVDWLPPSMTAAIANNKPHRLPEHRIVSTDDRGEQKERFYDVASWPTELNEAKFGTILSALDVTQRVLVDTQRKDFVATLAHDLQTPVIASDRALSLIINKVTETIDADSLKLLVMLKKNNENLLHMIESLLDVYHYEAGAQALYFDEIDIRLLIMACIDELKPLAADQGLTLDASLPENLGLVLADRTAIRRVITNLLDNALKFTPAGGNIDVSGRTDGDTVIIEVCDNGVGIPQNDQKHLFERYWHSTAKKTFKNSNGLGLYLCKQIIDSHHGKIECESEVGKLTKFKIVLPIKQQSQTTIPSKSHAEITAI
jgi:signal transduction histidine kinase/DNA-binding response OmpR family regulator